MKDAKLGKYTLADLRACWGVSTPPAAKAPKTRGPRKAPALDLGPGNCNLLDVHDWHEGPNYRRHAAEDVTWMHRAFKQMGERVRIVKRRHAENGRHVIRVIAVKVAA